MDSTELGDIAACQTGDLSRFDPIYLRHVDPVYKYLYRRTLQRALAEDLTSTTFLKAMESIRSFNADKGEIRSWLYRIARNALIDHYRRREPTLDIENVWGLAGDEFSDLSTELAINAEKVRTALSTLKPMQRDVVLLKVWEGLSHQEIADILGTSEGNSKVLFSRAMGELRTKLPSLLFLLLFPHSL
jgi:RNA polymerase sigma-70 factor (ECF subfamily)